MSWNEPETKEEAELVMDELNKALAKWRQMPSYYTDGTESMHWALEGAFRTGALAMHQIMKCGEAFADSNSKPQ